MDGLRSSYGNGFLDQAEHRQQYKLMANDCSNSANTVSLFLEWLLRVPMFPDLSDLAENQYDSNFRITGDNPSDPQKDQTIPHSSP